MQDNPIKVECPIEHKELIQDGYSIHYYTSGDKSKELIVFLHPAFADHRCFDNQIDFFSNNFRVITIDLLGHGLSSVNKSKDRIDHSIVHIDEIIKAESYEKANFVGVSMGSLIAQYYALNYPNKVKTLTIVGGYSINADNKEIAKAQRFESIKWIFMALISMNSFRRYVASVSLFLPEEKNRFYEMAKSFTRKSFLVMSGLGKVIQQRMDVKREYPLLILNGDKDIDLALRMSKKWYENEPNSSYQILKDAGHCANMDKPNEFNDIVSTFVQEKTSNVQ